MFEAKCNECGKSFYYELYGPVYPGCKTSEDILCPYCGSVCGSKMTSQFINTIKSEELSQNYQNPQDSIIEAEWENGEYDDEAIVEE